MTMSGKAEFKLAFRIEGMDCAEEVALLKREVGPMVGGDEHLSFDLLAGRMTVRLAAGPLASGSIEGAVARAGLIATPWTDEPISPEAAVHRLRRGRLFATTASGLATAIGLTSHAILGGGLNAAVGVGTPAVAVAFYCVAIGCGLWFVAPKAWLALRRGRSDMNLLMTVAVLGAVCIGEWFESATVSFLFALSLALESWSLGRARRAVAALLDLAPPRARVLSVDGREEDRLIEAIEVGSTIVVRPGERIPLDGRIIGGTTAVDEAPITGESIPVEKDLGSEVFAGTINGDGAIEVQTTRPARHTVLARIVRSVGQAQERRAPIEARVDRFACVYTPVVMAVAAATVVLPPILFGWPWSTSIYKGLVLLVIACPCALVISTPVSIVAALAAAARHGVLIKGGIFVEAPARLRAIALDKTGTLTEGRQRVVTVTAFNGLDEATVLRVAASLEARSGHPIARAILAHAAQQKIEPQTAANIQDLRGRGVCGIVDGQSYWAGSHRFLDEKGFETPAIHERLARMASGGRTVVIVGNDTAVLGSITVEDAIRSESTSVVAQLRALGIERVVLLTGDNRETAEFVGARVGISDVRSELLPEDKVRAVEELAAEVRPLAMVGDGVNDAPAMARADIGIAMGAAGSDAAIEAADIALMSDDLSRIPWLIGHSRRTVRIIRQNIGFSLVTKAVFVILTFSGYASLWAAIGADMGASLLVIANGLRLLAIRGR